LDITDPKAIAEGLLFIAEAPLKAERIAEVLEIERGAAKRLLDELLAEYAEAGRGFILVEVADGYQFRSRPEHNEYFRRLGRQRPFRFSRAALETLAIVAYRQPVTRPEIEYLRGVDSGGVLKTLLDKRLVRILGKREIPGRPMIYGTSREFLEFFGLRDLTGLPTLKEFSELAPETLAAADGVASGEAAEEGTPE
jgi:segregation and condensation protein B